MQESVANDYEQQINEAFSDNQNVRAWTDVHGKYECELVVQIDYPDAEEMRRLLRIDNPYEAEAVFKLIYASKDEGAKDMSERIKESV